MKKEEIISDVSLLLELHHSPKETIRLDSEIHKAPALSLLHGPQTTHTKTHGAGAWLHTLTPFTSQHTF